MEQAPQDPDRRCQHCRTALTDETTGGLCPRCLLEMNLASRTMPGGEPSPHIPPPSPEEMAARFPQFEILECLGRGGMGIVYKARQKTLDRLVAIKVLAGERHDDPQFEARFSREARTLAKLSHPNIVTVHDFGESDGMFYLVMEFVDGVNLRDVLHDGRMEPAQALAIVPEICAALQFAHDHGVVHRDIKPENILIDRDGRVKIADFGIAALIGADADRSGTPPYMAPEQQAVGGTIDHRADIYALGVVFYEMLTGERPEQDPSKPSKRVEIDVRLDEIVLRALEKEPARRYQTAGEFRTVVQTLAAPASPDVTAVPEKRPDRDLAGRHPEPADSGQSTRRNAWETTSLFAGTLFFILVSLFAWDWPGPFRLTLLVICGLGFGICALSWAGLWPFPSPIFPEPNFSSRNMRRRGARVALGSIVSLVVAVPALLFWAERPRLIDDRTIAANSPDEMYSAMGQTWHSMRIMGGDRRFYVFVVQGRAGAVFERWEVPVPTEKLATSYTLLSRDEILFGEHGEIVWSDDGKRVSFRVNGTEVSAYNTEDGGHSFQGGFLPLRVVELTPAPDTGCAFLDLDEGDVPKPNKQEIHAAGAGTGAATGWPQLVGTGIAEWMRSNGADFVIRGVTDPRVTLLEGVSIPIAELAGPRADSRAFDTIPAERVVEAVSIVERTLAEVPQQHPSLFGLNPGHIHAVKTREGAIAVVEILEASDRAPLRLRYKLVKPETTAWAAYEQTARAYMEAVRHRDYGKASALSARPLDRKEFDILASMMSTLYGADPDRLTEFDEFHREGAYAVARITSPPGQLDLRPSLILKLSGENWKWLGGPFPAAAGTSSAEELKRVWADFQLAESGEPGDEQSKSQLREVLPTLVDESDYQARLARRQKPPMERAVDALAHDNMVELVALAEYPSAGSSWWAPDGTVLEEPPVDARDFDLRSTIDPSKRWLTALFRVPGGLDPLLGGDSLQRADGGAWLWAGRQFRDGQPVDELAAIAVAFPAGAPRGDLTIRLARGAWRHEATVDAQALLAGGKAAEGETAWSVAERTDDRLVLQVRHPDNERQWRVGLLHQGQVTLAEPVRGNPGNAKDAAAPIVAWRFAGVESHAGSRFVLQSRPYEQIEFHDVALQPKRE